MERPTKIEVNRINKDNYEIVCVDELTGSECSINMPKNGYDALAAFFGKEAMEKITYESSGLNKPVVIKSVCGTNGCEDFYPNSTGFCKHCGREL